MQKPETSWVTYLEAPALAGLFCAGRFNEGCAPADKPTSVPIASASSLRRDLIGTRLDVRPPVFAESLVKLALPGAALLDGLDLADVGSPDGWEAVHLPTRALAFVAALGFGAALGFLGLGAIDSAVTASTPGSVEGSIDLSDVPSVVG